MDGQELTADQFLQQTDSSVMNSIQSFVQHANNLEETLGITSSWYLQNHLEIEKLSKIVEKSSKNRRKSSTFVKILKSRFSKPLQKSKTSLGNVFISLQLFKLYFYLDWVQVGTSKCSKCRNDPSRIFFGIFSRGKLTIALTTNFFLKMTSVWAVQWLDCWSAAFLRTLDFVWIYGFLNP